jgi:hypothetical protein
MTPMNAQISIVERARLAKLLALLGSDHAGERDAAGLAAHRLVQASGAGWSDVVCIPQDRAPVDHVGSDWRAVARAVSRHPRFLNRWEWQFIESLERFTKLSAKQQKALQTIVLRLRAAGMTL